jgi:hypothetical protein
VATCGEVLAEHELSTTVQSSDQHGLRTISQIAWIPVLAVHDLAKKSSSAGSMTLPSTEAFPRDQTITT